MNGHGFPECGVCICRICPERVWVIAANMASAWATTLGRLLPVRTMTAMRRVCRLTSLGMFRSAVSKAWKPSAFAAVMKASTLVGLPARLGGGEHRVFERVSTYGRWAPATWHDASCLGRSSVVGNGEVQVRSASFGRSRTVCRSASMACSRDTVSWFSMRSSMLLFPGGARTATRVDPGASKTHSSPCMLGRRWAAGRAS